MPIRRRWSQFSIRTLFLAVTILSVALGWLVVQLKWIHDRHEALEWLMQLRARQVAAQNGSKIPPRRGICISNSGFKAPWKLRILGESGVQWIEVDQGLVKLGAPYTPDKLRTLFPEAEAVRAVEMRP